MDKPKITDNYNASTKAGRENILNRILIDCDFDFSSLKNEEDLENVYENGLHWLNRVFNAGRDYQRNIDQTNIDEYFSKQAQHALGPWNRLYDSEVPRW